MLPTPKQLFAAGSWMTNGSHFCHAAQIFADQPEFKILSEAAIDDLKKAAEALGYELIERVPKPTARDGGRMDMAEGSDA